MSEGDKVLILTSKPSCAECGVSRQISQIGAVWKGFYGYADSDDQMTDSWLGYCWNCRRVVTVLLAGKVV